MNEYNRTNPFLYLLRKSEEELEQESRMVIQHLLCCLIVTISLVLAEIAFMITCYVSMWHIILLFTSIGSMIFVAYYIKKTFYQNRHQEINEMLLSDKFENIDLNNEKLLDSIIVLKRASGVMHGIYESITLLILIQSCFLLAVVIHFLIEI